MLIYLLKKSFSLVILFLGITLLSFCVIHLAPGRPVESSGELNPKMTPEVRQQLIKLYDLDKPLMVQYGLWLKRLIRCDFGRSFAEGRLVTEKLLETIPVTLAINGISLLIILGVGIPLGVFGALYNGRISERLLTIALFAGMAMPTFWLALVLMDLVCVQWGLLPISGLKSLDHEYMSLAGRFLDTGRHLILPVFVSSVGGLAGIARYVHENMERVLKSKFILACRGRNIPEPIILYRHALGNAILPVITIVGLSIPGLIGGSVIFESIFAIPGTGRLFYMAVMGRDYPVIMAMLVLSALLTLLGNALADVGYALADPRIRYENKE